ncbi:MAG: hypothetical protein ACK5O2_13395 [Microthrixaceae bacterium]
MPPPPGGGGGGFSQPPAQPYGAGGGQQLDVGTAISYGWNKFTENVGPFLMLVIGVFVAIVVVSVIAQFALVPAISGDDASLVLATIGFAVGMFLQIAVSVIVQIGMYRAGLGVTEGRTPAFSMFTDSTNIGPYILTAIVVALGAMVGYILCIIPGIIWIFFTSFAPLRALDKGEGPGDAIRGSIDMVRNNLGQVFLILLVSYLIYFAGAILCGVGLLVSIPVALVAICWTYKVIDGQPVAP